MAALEATILASVHKNGLGSFTLPGLLKVNVINVPAKKKRRGIDPFTKVERNSPPTGDREDQDTSLEEAQGRGTLTTPCRSTKLAGMLRAGGQQTMILEGTRGFGLGPRIPLFARGAGLCRS
jgi:hypothetical protein